MIRKIIYDEMPICRSEILRYSGSKKEDSNLDSLVDEMLKESRKVLKYSLCYDIFNVKIDNNICDFGVFRVESKALSKNLAGCKEVLIFAASVGSGIDRLISKYGRLSPTKALVLQSIGAERIEALCDKFCDDIGSQLDRTLKPRFSAGYGDVPLEVQSDIFRVLMPSKNIGLCLNDSLLMSPSKSVTAFVGITDECYKKKDKPNKCKSCVKADCEFRS